MRILLSAAFATIVTCAPLQAQGVSFDDFEAAVGERQSELDKFTQVLQGDDPDRRREAMRFMLQSGDPDLVRMAKEIGLFSPDRNLQNVALRAIFESQPRLRIVLKPDEENKEAVFQWIRALEGAHDAEEGSVSLLSGVYDEAERCWTFNNGRQCQWRLAGRNLNFVNLGIQGEFELEPDGVLRGTVFTHSGNYRGQAPAQIDLTE